MDKAYDAKAHESRIYQEWETAGYFKPSTDTSLKPFSIILPPPNANADLHVGHAMYVIEDIMARYHRMIGDATLWLPGADHAGFETQFVYEKHLAKAGKSRFDFDRETLFKNIWDFVHNNRSTMENQLRALGFSLDWSKNTFTLHPDVIKIVYQTFKKLHREGLVYRGQRLINYCTRCGTGFSDLEVKHVEQTDPLYYLKYGPFVLATVRPETKFGDTAVAVNPHDKRYKHWIGKEIEVQGLLGPFKIIVIGDEAIDPKFGTGVAKVTPAHDMTDFEISQRHKLPLKVVIGFNGRLTDIAGPYAGLKVKAAREKVVADMLEKGLIDHIDQNYLHTVSTCYKCGSVLEPLPLAQWFIKIRPLADKAIEAIKNKEVTFVPRRYEKRAVQWLHDFHDWNISRQIVWGIRIPAWRCLDCAGNGKEEWIVTDGSVPDYCHVCHGNTLEQDTDTFDTWFSSGQWPFATLRVNQPGDYDTFYPTSVMETGYDILPWWVCRMIMFGIYTTGTVPFRTVYLHGLVRDAKGQKMSKSKGNVINPLIMVDKYGADALRMALVYGTAAGNDLSLSEDKIRGMRNFANKLWNIGRFIHMNRESIAQNNGTIPPFNASLLKELAAPDKAMLKQLQQLVQKITKQMEHYRFSDAALQLYDFTWHTIADVYLEQNKERYKANDVVALAVLQHIFMTLLKLIHPFMPFVTEAVWQEMKLGDRPLIISSWPNHVGGKPNR